MGFGRLFDFPYPTSLGVMPLLASGLGVLHFRLSHSCAFSFGQIDACLHVARRTGRHCNGIGTMISLIFGTEWYTKRRDSVAKGIVAMPLS